MAILMCPDCKSQVSDRASVCPNCGYPIGEYVKEKEEKAKEFLAELKAQNKSCEELCTEIRRIISHNLNVDVKAYFELVKELEPESFYVKIYNAALALDMSEEDKINILKKNMKYFTSLRHKKVVECEDEALPLLGGVMVYIDNVLEKQEYGKITSGHWGKIKEHFDIPNYICLASDYEEIVNAVHCENLSINKTNRVALAASKYTDTENEIRHMLESYLQKFDSFADGYEIKRAWELPISSYFDRAVAGAYFELGRLIYDGSEDVIKTCLDTVQVQKNLIRFTQSILTFEPNAPRKPMGVGAGTFMGALIAGPVGAMVGYATTTEKNKRYERSVENARIMKVDNENRRAVAEENLSGMPLIEQKIKRHYFTYYFSVEYDIKVYFYLDETDEKLCFKYNEDLYNASKFVEISKAMGFNSHANISKKKELKKEHNIDICAYMYSYKLLPNLDAKKSKEEIVRAIYQELAQKVEELNEIEKLENVYREAKDLLSGYPALNVLSQKVIEKNISILEKKIRMIITISDCEKLFNIVESYDSITEKMKYSAEITEACIKLIKTEDDCKDVKAIIMREYITDKTKHIEDIEKKRTLIISIANENKEKEKTRRLEEIDGLIKEKTEYLESLYHGHRCPLGMVLFGILTVIGVILLFNKSVVGGVFLIYGSIGLIVLGITGRPSSRPAIPRVKQEIQELEDEKYELVYGKAPSLNNEKHISTLSNDNSQQFDGWICPECGKNNAKYIGTCSCGSARTDEI